MELQKKADHKFSENPSSIGKDFKFIEQSQATDELNGINY